MESTARLWKGCPLHSQKSGWISTTLHDLGAGGARNGHSVTCTWGRAERALAWLWFCVSVCFFCHHFSAIHPSILLPIPPRSPAAIPVFPSLLQCHCSPGPEQGHPENSCESLSLEELVLLKPAEMDALLQ